MWWLLLIVVYLATAAWVWCELQFLHDEWHTPLVLAIVWPVPMALWLTENLVEAAGDRLRWLWGKMVTGHQWVRRRLTKQE